MQNLNVPNAQRLYWLGGALAVVLLVALFWPSKKEQSKASAEQALKRPTGSFPLPPMDLEVPVSPRAKRITAEREVV